MGFNELLTLKIMKLPRAQFVQIHCVIRMNDEVWTFRTVIRVKKIDRVNLRRTVYPDLPVGNCLC